MTLVLVERRPCWNQASTRCLRMPSMDRHQAEMELAASLGGTSVKYTSIGSTYDRMSVRCTNGSRRVPILLNKDVIEESREGMELRYSAVCSPTTKEAAQTLLDSFILTINQSRDTSVGLS